MFPHLLFPWSTFQALFIYTVIKYTECAAEIIIIKNFHFDNLKYNYNFLIFTKHNFNFF